MAGRTFGWNWKRGRGVAGDCFVTSLSHSRTFLPECCGEGIEKREYTQLLRSINSRSSWGSIESLLAEK